MARASTIVVPEILTKHPEIALKVLTSQGARCGVGVTPKILTKCPADKFCALAGGELCVYGPRELAQMTQLSPAEVCQAGAGTGATGAQESIGSSGPSDPLLAAVCLLAGAVVTWRHGRKLRAAGKDGPAP